MFLWCSRYESLCTRRWP